MIASLIRFYGLTPEQIGESENEVIISLSQAMIMIKAQETIEQLKVADWPNLKKEARNKLYRDLNKQATGSILKEERKPLSAEHLAAILK